MFQFWLCPVAAVAEPVSLFASVKWMGGCMPVLRFRVGKGSDEERVKELGKRYAYVCAGCSWCVVTLTELVLRNLPF